MFIGYLHVPDRFAAASSCANRLSCRFVDVDPDQITGSDFEQPQADPKGEGQDARNNTRLRRRAQVIAARCSARVGSSMSSVAAR